MSNWINEAGAYLVALTADLDLKSVLLFLADKLFEGLFQAVTVLFVGWLVLYRQWRQLTQGKSDQFIFSANLLTPLGAEGSSSADGDQYLLQLRTVLAPKTIDQLLDNVALRRLTRKLAEQATLADPILATEGTTGFEIVNDIVNSVSGSLATSPFRRDSWLMAITCEDRRVVRKCCIRVILVRQADLARLISWDWCRDHILVEAWYHYWRIVTLHQVALRFQEEQASQGEGSANDIQASLLPLVDRQAHHPRIRVLSLGLNVEEPIIKQPVAIDWERYLPKIADLGLKLPGVSVPADGK